MTAAFCCVCQHITKQIWNKFSVRAMANIVAIVKRLYVRVRVSVCVLLLPFHTLGLGNNGGKRFQNLV